MRTGTWIAALLALLASLVVGMLLGPADLDFADWMAALRGQPGPATTIAWRVRLPRVVTGALTGGMLAVSGVVFQALLRNPLAEQYLLGVSSGAALGAVCALALGLSASAHFVLPLTALAGALVAIVVVFAVAQVDRRMDTRVLLLAGVVVSAFLSSCAVSYTHLRAHETYEGISYYVF